MYFIASKQCPNILLLVEEIMQLLKYFSLGMKDWSSLVLEIIKALKVKQEFDVQ